MLWCICCSVYKTTADYIPVDLSKESNVDAYVREIRKIYPHGVDILVNNAGNSMMNTTFKLLLYDAYWIVCLWIGSVRICGGIFVIRQAVVHWILM